MMGFNHVAGGVAFTGIFSSFNDVNIFEQPEYIAATVFFSLLPDIDHTRSIIGKVFYPIALQIDRKFGHRTITHSLIALLVVFIVTYTLESFFLNQSHITQIATLAYLSHIIFDMCTKSGVPFFYPFNTYRCVMPANPNLRLRSGDFKNEVIIFFVFVGLNFASFDLMANGFWTKYNQAFKTFTHLQREFERSRKTIEILARNRKNNQVKKGYVIEAKESEIVIFNSQFETLKEQLYEIEQINFSEKQLKKEELLFFDISVDSLNRLLAHPLLEIDLRSNTDFEYKVGAFFEQGSKVKLTFTTGFEIRTIDNKETVKAKLWLINMQIEAEHKKELESIKEHQALKIQLEAILSSFAALSSYEQGKAIKERETLKKQLKEFKFYKADTRELELQKTQLEKEVEEEQKFHGKALIFTVFSH